MNTSTSRKWLDAALQLLRDRNAQVRCPNCEKAVLRTHEVVDQGKIVSLRLYCVGCDSYNDLDFARSVQEDEATSEQGAKLNSESN